MEKAIAEINAKIAELEKARELLSGILNSGSGTPKAEPPVKEKEGKRPRDHLKFDYSGQPVSSATIQAARKIEGAFKVKQICREIYDYRGCRNRTRLHGAVSSALTDSQLIERVGVGMFRFKEAAPAQLSLAT
jgi:hypothetical protein